LKKISRKYFEIPFVLVVLFLLSSVVFAQHSQKYIFYYVDGAKNFQDFKSHLDKIDIIAPSSYKFDNSGVIWGSVDTRIISLAKKNNIGIMPLVANYKFDQKLLHDFLSDQKSKSRLITTLLVLCRQNGFMGIQFDCENLSMHDKNAFTNFYRQAADSLHKYGYIISDAIVHDYDDYNLPTEYFKWMYENWRGGYDLKALGKASDFISIMTYSEHTRRTTPGPEAGLPWIEKVIGHLLSYIPAEKISLGIPLDSQHWYTAFDTIKYFANARSWSDVLSYNSAMDLADRFNAKILWNEEEQVPYAIYDNGGLMEYIYFEDARSFKAKYNLIDKFKLLGFSAWVLGNEDPDIWKYIPSKK
jgi:spore germination protein YaaH